MIFVIWGLEIHTGMCVSFSLCLSLSLSLSPCVCARSAFYGLRITIYEVSSR